MSDPAFMAVQSVRAELRQRRQGPMMPRLWHLMRDEWQRVLDRSAVSASRPTGQVALRADDRVTCRGR